MGKKKDTRDVVEETATIESTDEPLVRQGQAVPVDPATGASAYDAPAAVAVVGVESTSHVLAKVPGSAESKAKAHNGGYTIGAASWAASTTR